MKLLALIAFAFFTTLAFSQRSFFVYLESPDPFFVKLADRTYSSGSAGYVIIPGLADSLHLIRVGFPQNRFLTRFLWWP